MLNYYYDSEMQRLTYKRIVLMDLMYLFVCISVK